MGKSNNSKQTVHFHDNGTAGPQQHFRASSDELLLWGDEGLTAVSAYFTWMKIFTLDKPLCWQSVQHFVVAQRCGIINSFLHYLICLIGKFKNPSPSLFSQHPFCSRWLWMKWKSPSTKGIFDRLRRHLIGGVCPPPHSPPTHTHTVLGLSTR